MTSMVVPVDSQPTPNSLKFLFFGLPGMFSAAILRRMLLMDLVVGGVVVPAASVPHLAVDGRPVQQVLPLAGNVLPLATESGEASGLLELAWEAAVPVFAVADLRDPSTIAALREVSADVGMVACFDRRIPAAVYCLPRLGTLNIHPSLLPAFRGPSPMFWAWRAAAERYGVSLHFLDEGLDTGDIVAQVAVDLPDGISGSQADVLLVEAGAGLLGGLLPALHSSRVESWPQDLGGSYQGNPQAADFELSTGWTARHAFNFMHGTAEWGYPYPVLAGSQRWLLASAVGYDPTALLSQPVESTGDRVRIQFSTGVLDAQLAGTGVG